MQTKIHKSLPLYLMGYEKIKELIIDGTLAAGQRLTDNQLSEMLGISRTPVREAVRMLCREGLLKGEEGVVTAYEPSLKELGELYVLRGTLEGLAVASIIAQNSQLELTDELARIVAVSRDAYAAQDFGKVVQCNRQFHNRIVQGSGNDLIADHMKAIDGKINIYRRLSLQRTEHVEASIEGHLKMIDFMQQGDIMAGRKYMEQHIFTAGHRLFMGLSAQGNINGRDSDAIRRYLIIMKDL